MLDCVTANNSPAKRNQIIFVKVAMDEPQR